MKFFCITFLFLTFLSSFLRAQSYPTDKQKFIKYVDQLLSENENEKVRSFPNNELKDNLLKNGIIDDETFDKIVSTCNSMESNGLKSYPDIFNYLYSVNFVHANKTNQESISSWQDVLDAMLLSKHKATSEFLKFSIHFFLYGKISEAGGSKWYYKTGEFFFNLDKGYELDKNRCSCRKNVC